MENFLVLILGISMFITCGMEFVKPSVLKKKIAEYESGLKTTALSKDEVTQRIKNLNCFLIKQVSYNEKGNIEIIGKAGKHTLIFEDGVIKSAGVKAFLERKKYKLAVEEMAIFDFLAKEENPDLPINPYTRYKRGKALDTVSVLAPCALIISMIIVIIINVMPTSEKYIDAVRTSTPENYPNITYGEAFDNFFSNPDWKHFSSEKGEIVEFTGDFYFMDTEVEGCFQYIVSMEEGTYRLQYFGINDVSQDMLTTGIVLEKVFSSYGDFGELSIQEESINEVEKQTVSDVVTIPESMFYDSEVIDYMDMAGRYTGIVGTEVSLSMYSSIEDMYVGSIQIQTSNGNYSGEVVQLDTNIYRVESTDETVIVFGVSRIVAGDVQLDLYINGEQIDYVTMIEPYIS